MKRNIKAIINAHTHPHTHTHTHAHTHTQYIPRVKGDGVDWIDRFLLTRCGGAAVTLECIATLLRFCAWVEELHRHTALNGSDHVSCVFFV